MIYYKSILASRCPTPEEVHERNFGAIWEDVPSPLLAVNKQIRDEVFNVLHKDAFTMRVTSYGASFDMLGLSCFIAQQRPKSYSGLPKLIIEIWPPHPDRPIEAYNINRHIRDLRNELRATSVGIASLIIWFRENKIAKWTRDDGQARFDLDPGNEKVSAIQRHCQDFVSFRICYQSHQSPDPPPPFFKTIRQERPSEVACDGRD